MISSATSPVNPSMNTSSTPEKKNGNGSIRNLLLLAFFVLLTVAGYWMAKSYLSPGEARTNALATDCDLTKTACSSVFATGESVEFSISPKTIPLMKPIQITVNLDQVEANKVEVDFAGVSMNMGYNRPKLTPDKNGVYQAEVILPVCIRKHMEWEARVIVTTADETLISPFRFDTYR